MPNEEKLAIYSGRRWVVLEMPTDERPLHAIVRDQFGQIEVDLEVKDVKASHIYRHNEVIAFEGDDPDVDYQYVSDFDEEIALLTELRDLRNAIMAGQTFDGCPHPDGYGARDNDGPLCQICGARP